MWYYNNQYTGKKQFYRSKRWNTNHFSKETFPVYEDCSPILLHKFMITKKNWERHAVYEDIGIESILRNQ